MLELANDPDKPQHTALLLAAGQNSHARADLHVMSAQAAGCPT